MSAVVYDDGGEIFLRMTYPAKRFNPEREFEDEDKDDEIDASEEGTGSC